MKITRYVLLASLFFLLVFNFDIVEAYPLDGTPCSSEGSSTSTTLTSGNNTFTEKYQCIKCGVNIDAQNRSTWRYDWMIVESNRVDKGTMCGTEQDVYTKNESHKYFTSPTTGQCFETNSSSVETKKTETLAQTISCPSQAFSAPQSDYSLLVPTAQAVMIAPGTSTEVQLPCMVSTNTHTIANDSGYTWSANGWNIPPGNPSYWLGSKTVTETIDEDLSCPAPYRKKGNDTCTFNNDGHFSFSCSGSASLPSFSAWRQNTFASLLNSSESSDPDRDGLTNIWEYAIGTNPLVAETLSPISSFISNNYFTFQYPVNKNRTDISVRIGATNSLFGSWNYDAMSFTSQDIDADTSLVTATDNVAVSSVVGGRYFRMELTPPPTTPTTPVAASAKMYLSPSREVYNKLSVTKTGNGSVVSSSVPDQRNINCGTFCSIDVESGTVETLYANADKGYKFDGWSGDCSFSKTEVCVLTMSSSKNVSASFTKIVPPSAPVLSNVTVVNQQKSAKLKNLEKELKLNWKDTSSNEDGFIVERALWSFPKRSDDFRMIGSVGRNTDSYIDVISDNKDSRFVYRVKAYNMAGDSAYSDPIYVRYENGKDIRVYSTPDGNTNFNSASVFNSDIFGVTKWFIVSFLGIE